MKIYSFWSGDTTYYTKSKSIKKAQAVGKEVMKHYLETCEYLEEKPELDADERNRYFIPTEVDEVKKEWLLYSVKTDKDIMILDEELYQLIKE